MRRNARPVGLGLVMLCSVLAGCAGWPPPGGKGSGSAPQPGEDAPAREGGAAEPAGGAAAPGGVDAPAREVTPAGGLTEAEAEQVRRLLTRADRAIAEDHLTYPASGSALALYDQVAILDPDNEAMKRGLERIVERYLELALTAAERRQFSRARAMIDRSRLVDPDHPSIEPTEAQIQMLGRADRRVIELDGQWLRDHDARLLPTLHQAGAASRDPGCRAEIVARSDAEGRWIYQQMSEARGRDRIQAQLTIGSPPRIEVLCFSDRS